MKKIFFAFFVGIASIMLLSSCKTSNTVGDITMSFEVQNLLSQDLVLVYDMDIHPVELDAQGKGSFVVKGKKFLYFKIFLGQEYLNAYLEAGDNVTINLDARNLTNLYKVSGDRQPVFDYLNTISYTSLPDEQYALELEQYKEKLAEKEVSAEKILSNSFEKVSGHFIDNEKARVRYSYGASRIMYSVGHMLMSGNADYKPDAAYYDYVSELVVEDESILDLEEYRNYMIEAAAMLSARGEKRDFYHKTLDQMEYFSEKISSPSIRESLMYHTMVAYVEQVGTDNIAELSNYFHAYVKDTAMVASFKEKCAKWDFSAPGRISPDFKAVDMKGNQRRLADFRGKYVYIDLWATWCLPCRRELPYLAELEKKFSNRNIFFVSLSIDKNKEDWEAFVKSNEMTGEQLYIGDQNSFLKAYRVDGIPRFILLDKEGKIIDNNMTRPSSKDTAEMLETLPGM